MSHERHNYQAYLLRLWRSETRHGSVWRASLDSPHTGERYAFATLAALFAFLEKSTLQDTTRSGIETHLQ
jgi:hypothetical protein